MQQDAVATFDRLAGSYDDWYRTSLGALVDRLEKEALFAIAPTPSAGLRALDIGCGTGNYTFALAARGVKAIGLDAAPGMIAQAQAKAETYRTPVSFVIGRAEALPFADETFDLVISVTVLEFVQRVRRVLHEAWSVLRPGGTLLVGVLNRWSLWALQRKLQRQRDLWTQSRFFSPPELLALLQPLGRVTWRSAIFVPPWWQRPPLGAALALEAFGRRALRPFGAFLAASVRKEG